MNTVSGVPFRSTYSYINTKSFFLSQGDNIKLRSQWDKFESIENYDSIVYNQLINATPTIPNAMNEKGWYKFSGDVERNTYLSGQQQHIAEYPLITEFQVSYSKKPIVYVPSVLSTISTIEGNFVYVNPATISTARQMAPLLNKSPAEIMQDRTGLNLYVRVSTQTSTYPKSPYRFSGNEEFMLYQKYRMLYGPR